MDLVKLKFLVAGSLLAGGVSTTLKSSSGGRCTITETTKPGADSIEQAVKSAQEIWEEVLKQDRQ